MQFYSDCVTRVELKGQPSQQTEHKRRVSLFLSKALFLKVVDWIMRKTAYTKMLNRSDQG